jgi:hypothetical protein
MRPAADALQLEDLGFSSRADVASIWNIRISEGFNVRNWREEEPPKSASAT